MLMVMCIVFFIIVLWFSIYHSRWLVSHHREKYYILQSELIKTMLTKSHPIPLDIESSSQVMIALQKEQAIREFEQKISEPII
jgi:hypothetical protein